MNYKHTISISQKSLNCFHYLNVEMILKYLLNFQRRKILFIFSLLNNFTS